MIGSDNIIKILGIEINFFICNIVDIVDNNEGIWWDFVDKSREIFEFV